MSELVYKCCDIIIASHCGTYLVMLMPQEAKMSKGRGQKQKTWQLYDNNREGKKRSLCSLLLYRLKKPSWVPQPNLL